MGCAIEKERGKCGEDKYAPVHSLSLNSARIELFDTAIDVLYGIV